MMMMSLKERLLGPPAPRAALHFLRADFSPALLRLQREMPSPLPRLVLRIILGLLAVLLVWSTFGRLDVVAVAPGKLVPMTYLKVVQPAESGIVKQLLVQEGDEVKAGQVLVRMDRAVSEADSRSFANELAVKRMQLRRIDAELAGKPMQQQSGDSPEMFAEVAAQYRARRQAYLDGLEAEQAALAKADQDYRAALQQEAKFARIVPLVQAQDAGWQQLVKEGFAGKLMALDKTSVRVEQEQELAAQHHAVQSLKANLDQSKKKIAQITSTYHSQLLNERVEAAAQLHKLQQDSDKQSHRESLLELRAPQGGIIKDLATHTAGTVVQPGTILMTLVPRDEPMQAEVSVANLDAGFVQMGQKAKIKLVPYPFQEYGMVEGKVIHISPDSTEPAGQGENKPPSLTAEQKQVGYRTLVALKTPYLEADGKRYHLSPGMQVTAEIHLGTRTVLGYLLSPVRKVVFEAGREM
jgi:HlyD family secretion protein